jgi:cation diffusion facilitator CzcD-associated flavoprotein CzcO
VFERDSTPGGKWSGRGIYGCVQIQQHKEDFYLPEMAWPEGMGEFGDRDNTINLLSRYMDNFGLEQHVRCRTAVTLAEYIDETKLWTTVTSAGEKVQSRYVAFATGTLGRPLFPEQVKNALANFEGEIVHAHNYFRPLPFEGKRVVVLGFGASGVEIAQDLAWNGKCASVTMVARPHKVHDADGTRQGMDWCLSRVLPDNGSRTCSGGTTNSLDVRNEITYAAMKKRHPTYPECMPPALQPTCKLVGKPVCSGDGRPLGGRVIVSEGFLDGVAEGKINVVPGQFEGSRANAVLASCAGHTDVWLDADVVIACTGYELPTQVIAPLMKPSPASSEHLYKGVWFPHAPNAGLVGHDYGFIAVPPTAHMQAKYFARVASGQEEVPALDVMRAWVHEVEEKQVVTQRFTVTEYYQSVEKTWLGAESDGHADVAPKRDLPSPTQLECKFDDSTQKASVNEALHNWPTSTDKVNVLNVSCDNGSLIRGLMDKLTASEQKNANVVTVSQLGGLQEVAERSIDIAICNGLLSQAEPASSSVSEFLRVMRIGGHVVLDLAETAASGWQEIFDSYERPQDASGYESSDARRLQWRLVHVTAPQKKSETDQALHRQYVFRVMS